LDVQGRLQPMVLTVVEQNLQLLVLQDSGSVETSVQMGQHSHHLIVFGVTVRPDGNMSPRTTKVDKFSAVVTLQ
jgi:hypothetical protein